MRSAWSPEPISPAEPWLAERMLSHDNDIGARVSTIEKLIEKMSRSPSSIRFSEAETLLRRMGFVLFNSRGSHRTYHHADGRLLTLVQPHGGRKTCNPQDIRRLLKVLDL